MNAWCSLQINQKCTCVAFSLVFIWEGFGCRYTFFVFFHVIKLGKKKTTLIPINSLLNAEH